MTHPGRAVVGLLLMITALSCTNHVDSPTITPKEAEQVMKTLIQGDFDEVWGGVDTAAVGKYQTDDFYILEQGEVWDNARIKDYMLKQKARANRPKRINKMEYISIEMHGDAIIAAYDNYADFLNGDSLVAQAHWLESAVAIPTDEGWRLRCMHSTRVKN